MAVAVVVALGLAVAVAGCGDDDGSGGEQFVASSTAAPTTAAASTASTTTAGTAAPTTAAPPTAPPTAPATTATATVPDTLAVPAADRLAVFVDGCGGRIDDWSLAFAPGSTTVVRITAQIPEVGPVVVDVDTASSADASTWTMTGADQPSADFLQLCQDVAPVG
ncbi:MAG: hypothetical protein IPM45_14970 [Acidimicrobiales bacterium]|nr:hypothetical protein [Acidimicrobiales bacterium]